MGCEFDRETAFKRAKGLLAKEALVEYDGHLATCERCVERFVVARATVGALQAAEKGATREVDWGRVYHASKEAFAEGHVRAVEGPRVNLRVWIPAAAAVAAGMALFVWVSAGERATKSDDVGREVAVVTPSTGRINGVRAREGRAEWRVVSAARGKVGGVEVREGAVVTVGEKIATGRGGSATITVGAASRIEIASASVVVPLRVSETRTEIELERGKLTAHIAPKVADGRFAVRAGAWRVEVTGTVFTVERIGEGVRVETVDGSVRVSGPGLDEARIVTAGESFESMHSVRVRRAPRETAEPHGPRRVGGRVERATTDGSGVRRRVEARRDDSRPRAERAVPRELRREVDEFRRAGDELLREYDR